MDRLINTALVLVSIAVWMLKTYGALPLMRSMKTGKIAKHAATGHASRRAGMHWLGAGHRPLGHATPASLVIARLRAERARSAWVLAA